MTDTRQPQQDELDAPTNSRHDELRPAAGFWILMFASLIVVGGLAFLQFLRTPRVGAGRSGGTLATNLPEISSVPDMTLTDQHGKPVILSRDLRGRPWIADFVFTSCAGPCPVMTERMVALQKSLIDAGMKDVLCVSVSVDPARDTPQKLRNYAETWKPVDPANWLLLTGEKAQIRDLVTKHFLLALQEETPESAILHSSKFVLVDKRGRVRATYDVMSEEEQYETPALGTPMSAEVREKIIKDVKSVLAECVAVTFRDLPHVNASLNALATVLLLAGYICIKQRRIAAHATCMVSAFITSIVFLACYMTYHTMRQAAEGVGHTKFAGTGAAAKVYYTLLISHVILAAIVPVLAIITLRRALRRDFVRHKAIARWTWPIWMYVSVTGVIVYFMLYHWYAPAVR